MNNLAYLDAEQFNQPDKAYDLAQKARTLDPANPAVADTLGWAAFKRGDYQQALALFQESAGKAGNNPEIQFHLGMAHYMMGQADPARDAFQKAIGATGDFPSKAEAESRLKLLESASGSGAAIPVEQLEAMLNRQPNDLVVQLRLAEAYEKQAAWAKAAGAYEAALKVNPKLPSATLKLAQLYSGPVPNKEKALAYAKQARTLSPNDPKATGVLGQIAFANGDFSWAYNLLQESARQLDSDPQVLHDLAWATYSLGNVPDARDAMQRSLKASPDPATAEDAKAFLALTALEGTPTALAGGKAASSSKLKADPSYVPALMADAALDVQNNNKTAAVSRYQEVLRRFPDFAPAQEQLASLYV
ncbi:MAG: tetratricopeptide repeat protein, partial [Rhodanobacteraceae bacterium]